LRTRTNKDLRFEDKTNKDLRFKDKEKQGLEVRGQDKQGLVVRGQELVNWPTDLWTLRDQAQRIFCRMQSPQQFLSSENKHRDKDL